MSQIHPHILRRIQETKDKGLTELDLSYPTTRIKLTQIPPELFDLKHLESLNLRHQAITVLPEALLSLPNLTHVDLRGLPLHTLPPWLPKAKNLNSVGFSWQKSTSPPKRYLEFERLYLDLSGNKFIALPDWLAQLSNLTSLNLSHNKLRDLPNWLAQLSKLTSLNLSANNLTALPDEMAQLSKLTYLNLRGIKLTVLPEWLAQLSNLTRLNLQGNNLMALPDGLAQLSKLTYLNLRGIKLTVLPDGLAQLSKLTYLNLWGIKLTVLPEWMAQLSNLTYLNLGRNKLTVLPEWMVQLNNLTSLNLYKNPIETPPPEVLNLDHEGWANLKNIKNYFRQLQEEGVEHLYEAKLLIIGEAKAGKTSVAKKILDPAYQLIPDEASTEGIDVLQWGFSMASGQPFRVNIWDFGGQEIYHATHQFFLTKRSLYALVADPRKEDSDFTYWLNVVELFSDNSPLLIIKNEKQDRHFEINEPQLRGQFTNFKETLATNLADNRGLEHIRDSIKHYIAHLPHIGAALPKTWVNVRQALERDPRDYISLDTYLDLCQQHGFKRLADKLQLSSYLHDLGICLHFQNDPLLKQTVILKPTWGTDAVYRVLDNEHVIRGFGRFTQINLARIWSEEKYAAKQDELLRLMINFQLCYEIPNSPGEYIAPQLLTKIQPAYEWTEDNNLILRYTYEFMPKGILTRLTVIMHPLIATQDQVWRSGVVLAKDNTLAEVIEDYGKREIGIRVVGKHKRDLLTIIIHELDKIHTSFNRLKFKRLIPCNCRQCKSSQAPHFYDYENLRNRLSNQHYQVECDKSFQMVEVLGLIDDIGARELPSDRRPEIESLQTQLLQHRRNLNKLEEQAAKYASSEVPLRLLNQIDDEKKSIDNLEDELGRLENFRG